MGRRVDLLVDLGGGVFADAMVGVLQTELDGAVIHHTADAPTIGRFDAVVVRAEGRVSVDTDLVVVLPADDDPTGVIEVHRGDDVLSLPLDDAVLPSLVQVLRDELD